MHEVRAHDVEAGERPPHEPRAEEPDHPADERPDHVMAGHRAELHLQRDHREGGDDAEADAQ